jgi:hypothetical protein
MMTMSHWATFFKDHAFVKKKVVKMDCPMGGLIGKTIN